MTRVLKKDWLAVPAGEIYPVLCEAGGELKGELLDRAEGLGLMEDRKKPAKAKADEEAAAAAKAKAEEEAAAAAKAKGTEGR